MQINQTLPQPDSFVLLPRKFSKGETLYIHNCADCHGWEGRGKGAATEFMAVPTPTLLNNELLTKKSENQFVDWVLSGVTLKLQLTGNTGPRTDSKVTAILTHIKKLPAINWNKIEAGQKVYDELCIACHGIYGRGDGGLASQMPGPLPDLSLSDYHTQQSNEELLHIIKKGKDAMPGTEDVLSSEEIKNVIAFVRLLSPGYESYDRFCANCHGVKGTTMQILALTADEEKSIEMESIDLLPFDAAYFKAHTDKQLFPKVKHMLKSESMTMPHFDKDLKPSEVREIFRYLSSLMAEYP